MVHPILIRALSVLPTPLLNWLRLHTSQLRRGGLALLCVGAAAYALASVVVSFGPDAAHLPVREVSQTVESLPTQPQLDVLSKHNFNLYRSDISRTSDTAEGLLKRLAVNDPQAVAFLRVDKNAQQTLFGRTGRHLKVEVDNNQRLLSLSARWSPDDDGSFKRLLVTRTGQTFNSALCSAELRASLRFASGTIQSSLFGATDDAQVPDAVAVQVAEIFSGDIDFHRDLRKGDRFTVIYEMLEGDGEPLRAGRVLSTEFVNAGKSFQAMWFQEPIVKDTAKDAANPATSDAAASGEMRTTHSLTRGGYYTLDGQSLKRAYLASPLAFSRVTSGFKMRLHPILQQWRAHLGVDYAAPIGTPVRSVGDGVIEFAGAQGGFGNVIFIRHRNNHVTVYAHLSRIGVKRSQRVAQGQIIGATGATGWATGPHLHYEFRVNGAHQNPLLIARRSESIPVSASAKPLFLRQAAAVRQQLATASSLQSSSAQ